MPLLERQGTEIYWDEEGEGPPVLLIMGLGWSSAMWHRIRPVLAAKYRTIAFDNRGTGRSGSPVGSYRIGEMADDAAAVLDIAGICAASVFGFSLGGMIALELACRYPDRILSLVLGSAALGGRQMIRPSTAVLNDLRSIDVNSPGGREALLPFIYADSTPRSRIEEDLRVGGCPFSDPDIYTVQLKAVVGWNVSATIHRIVVPVMLIHGSEDRLVPAENCRMIAGLLQQATVHVLPQGGHMFMTDQPETTQLEILRFLSRREVRTCWNRSMGVRRYPTS